MAGDARAGFAFVRGEDEERQPGISPAATS
jgi:hypothetical protein